MFGKLLPRDGNFFNMFNQHANYIVEAARAFSQLVTNYDDPVLREKYSRNVIEAEHGADRVTKEVNQTLHKSFITPIDREQIRSLINTMDDVADMIQDSAEIMGLYDVRKMTGDMVRLTELSLKCCERICYVVSLIGDMGNPATVEAVLKIAMKSTSWSPMPTA
jgi:predicted phosphate transport protein (TIGR00153 family)